jgi:hypothetical protein
LSWAHPVAFFIALGLALVVMVALIWMFGSFLRTLLRRVFAAVPAAGSPR